MATRFKNNANFNYNVNFLQKQVPILDRFAKLADEDERIRVESGVVLLKHLSASVNRQNGKSEVLYSLNRIIRGVGSSNVTARTGYYALLVSVLTQHEWISLDQINECVGKHLKASGSNSKGENSDIYMGQILVYGALIRSKLFFKLSVSQQKLVLGQILICGKKKSYLTLAACMFFVDLIDNIKEDEFKNVVWPVLRLEVLKPWEEQNLDYAYLLSVAQNKFSNVVDRNVFKNTFGCAEFITDKNVQYLCKILMDIPMNAFLRHPGYAVLSQEISKSSALIAFVSKMDEYLTNPTRNKLLAALIIMTNIILSLNDPSLIPNLMMHNFIRRLQQNSSGPRKNRDFQITEKNTKLFKAIFATLRKDAVNDETRIECLRKFLLYPGSMYFEKHTRSKIVQQITAILNVNGTKKLAELYRNVVEAKTKKQVSEARFSNWLNAERLYAGQMLSKLLTHPSIRDDVEWKIEQLKLLLHYGLVKDETTQNVGTELAASLRETFYYSLDLKFPKLEHLSGTLLSLVHFLNSLLSRDDCGEIIRVSLTTEALEIWQKTFELITKMEKKPKHNKQLTIVFYTLFLHLSLQLFKEQKLAVSSLQELFRCYDKVNEQKKSKMTKVEEIKWIEVVVDLFLNLLSHNSLLLRRRICCVFPHLCKYMTPSAVHQILAVLDPESEMNPPSNTSESDSEESDDDSNDDKDSNNDENEEDDDEDFDEDSDEDFDEDFDEEENETISDKLRLAVRQALGNDGAQTDEESIDLDAMDENEAENVDKALAQAFKQFKPNLGQKNKKQSKDDKTLTHFRVRALDLVEIYLDSEPPMLTCLEIMPSLLCCLEFSVKDEHQKPLENRLRTCLRKLTSLRKFSSLEGVTENILIDLIENLFSKGTKSFIIAQEIADKISECCLFLIKCLQIIGMPQSTKLSEILLKALEETFFKARDCTVSYVLFKNLFAQNWEGILELVPSLYTYVLNTEIKPFKKNHALELLKIFYTNIRFLNSNKEKIQIEIVEHERKFSKDLIEFLQELCNNSRQSSITEKFVANLFLMLGAVKGSPLEDDSYNWEEIEHLIKQYRQLVTFSKDARVAYFKLQQKLRSGGSYTYHQKGDEDDQGKAKKIDKGDADYEEDFGKQKKAQLSSKARKLKKETQMKRLEDNSKGLLGNFSFVSDELADKEEMGLSDEKEESDVKDATPKKKKKLQLNEGFQKEKSTQELVTLITEENKITAKDKKKFKMKKTEEQEASDKTNELETVELINKEKVKRKKKRSLNSGDETTFSENSNLASFISDPEGSMTNRKKKKFSPKESGKETEEDEVCNISTEIESEETGENKNDKEDTEIVKKKTKKVSVHDNQADLLENTLIENHLENVNIKDDGKKKEDDNVTKAEKKLSKRKKEKRKTIHEAKVAPLEDGVIESRRDEFAPKMKKEKKKSIYQSGMEDVDSSNNINGVTKTIKTENRKEKHEKSFEIPNELDMSNMESAENVVDRNQITPKIKKEKRKSMYESGVEDVENSNAADENKTIKTKKKTKDEKSVEIPSEHDMSNMENAENVGDRNDAEANKTSKKKEKKKTERTSLEDNATESSVARYGEENEITLKMKKERRESIHESGVENTESSNIANDGKTIEINNRKEEVEKSLKIPGEVLMSNIENAGNVENRNDEEESKTSKKKKEKRKTELEVASLEDNAVEISVKNYKGNEITPKIQKEKRKSILESGIENTESNNIADYGKTIEAKNRKEKYEKSLKILTEHDMSNIENVERRNDEEGSKTSKKKKGKRKTAHELEVATLEDNAIESYGERNEITPKIKTEKRKSLHESGIKNVENSSIADDGSKTLQTKNRKEKHKKSLEIPNNDDMNNMENVGTIVGENNGERNKIPKKKKEKTIHETEVASIEDNATESCVTNYGEENEIPPKMKKKERRKSIYESQTENVENRSIKDYGNRTIKAKNQEEKVERSLEIPNKQDTSRTENVESIVDKNDGELNKTPKKEKEKRKSIYISEVENLEDGVLLNNVADNESKRMKKEEKYKHNTESIINNSNKQKNKITFKMNKETSDDFLMQFDTEESKKKKSKTKESEEIDPEDSIYNTKANSSPYKQKHYENEDISLKAKKRKKTLMSEL